MDLKIIRKKIVLAYVLILLMFTSAAYAVDRSLNSINAKAYGLLVKGDYDAAILTYKKAIVSYPSYAPLYDGLGTVYLKKKQYYQAYTNYNTASKLDSGSSIYKIHAQESNYRSRMNGIESAKQLIGKASILAPNDSRINDNVENILSNKFRNLNLLTDSYQDATDANLTNANQFSKLKEYQKANQLYTQSIKSSKLKFQAYNNLGLMYLNQNKFNNAIFYLKKAISLNPKAEYAYNNLGVVYAKLKKPGSAVNYFNAAINANKLYSSAYNNKAVYTVNDAIKNVSQSVKYLETIVKYEPENVYARQLLGSFYCLNGDYDSAVSIYKESIDYARDNDRYLGKLADALYANKQYYEAITYYKKALAINSTNSYLYLGLARSFEKSADYKSAQSYYQTAIRTDSENSDIYKYFGYFLLSQKREAEAKGILKKYLDLSSEKCDFIMVQGILKALS